MHALMCRKAQKNCHTHTDNPLWAPPSGDGSPIESHQGRQGLRHPVGHHGHRAEHRSDLQHGDAHVCFLWCSSASPAVPFDEPWLQTARPPNQPVRPDHSPGSCPASQSGWRTVTGVQQHWLGHGDAGRLVLGEQITSSSITLESSLSEWLPPPHPPSPLLCVALSPSLSLFPVLSKDAELSTGCLNLTDQPLQTSFTT